MNSKTKYLFVLLFAITISHKCHSQRLIELREDGKTYVRLQAQQPKQLPDFDGVNPRLLIPHYNPETELWGYIRRDSKELVVAHRFTRAGCYAHGFAIATLEPADSLPSQVFRIDSMGQVVCIHADASTPAHQSHAETRRRSDDYVQFRDQDHIRFVNPAGKLALDTIIPGYLDRFTYNYGGYFTLYEAGKLQFWSFADGMLAAWDTARYHIVHFNPHYREQPTPHPYFRILERKTKRMGILDVQGKLIVPMDWEEPGKNATDLPRLFQPLLCDPSIDSLYYAYRDKHYFLMHLNGTTVCTYNDSIAPNARMQDLWRSDGLLYVRLIKPEGKAREALWDPRQRRIVFSCNCILSVLDRHRVFEGYSDTYWIRDLQTGERRKIPGVDSYLDLNVMEVCRAQGHAALIVEVPHDGQQAVVDAQGKMLFDLQYQTIHPPYYQFQPSSLLHVMQDSAVYRIHRFYTLDGQQAFGGPLRELRFPYEEGHPGDCERRSISDEKDSDLQPIDRDQTLGNTFQYVKVLVTGKRLAQGYVDAQGVRYY